MIQGINLENSLTKYTAMKFSTNFENSPVKSQGKIMKKISFE